MSEDAANEAANRRRPRPGGSQAVGTLDADHAAADNAVAAEQAAEERTGRASDDADRVDSASAGVPAGGSGAAKGEDTAPDNRPKPRVSRAWAATTAVLLLALITALVLGVMSYLDIRADDARTARDQAALTAAQEGVGKLINLDYKKADTALAELLDSATGDFANQLGDEQGPFGKALVKGKVQSSGQVLSSGIVSASDSEVKILVFATARVTNVEAKKGENRQYRIEATMVPQENRWLIEKLRFVP